MLLKYRSKPKFRFNKIYLRPLKIGRISKADDYFWKINRKLKAHYDPLKTYNSDFRMATFQQKTDSRFQRTDWHFRPEVDGQFSFSLVSSKKSSQLLFNCDALSGAGIPKARIDQCCSLIERRHFTQSSPERVNSFLFSPGQLLTQPSAEILTELTLPKNLVPWAIWLMFS